jgi:dTDP-4-dehydrorhamnose reductase
LKTDQAKPRVLLLGKNGQIGFDLTRMLAQKAEVHAPDRSVVDLTRPESIRNAVATLKPDVILNAAAYTSVDKAESEPELAAVINAEAPAVLAQAAHSTGSLLVHYSTDYVFDGTKHGPYVEKDPINPLSVYGRTKASGEEAVANSGCDYLILRTSWVFSSRGTNFLLTMLRLGQAKPELRIVNDQRGAPTSSETIATATLQILDLWRQSVATRRKELIGRYHATSAGQTTWFEFASEIFHNQPNTTQPALVPISSEEYPTAARRPRNSVLDCGKLKRTFGIEMPHWRESLLRVLAQVE